MNFREAKRIATQTIELEARRQVRKLIASETYATGYSAADRLRLVAAFRELAGEMHRRSTPEDRRPAAPPVDLNQMTIFDEEPKQ